MTPVKKVCVITGGTSGIGLCTAQAMLEKGYTVYELSRRAEGAPGMKHIMADVTKEETLAAAVQEILKQEDHIDVLINNAGGGVAIKPVAEQTKAEIDRAILLNLNSVIYAANTFAPLFMAQRAGTILNMSSVCARQCWPEWSVYAAAKAGVLNFSKGLYTELQPYGVRVTCLIPAAASTGFQKASGIGEVNNILGTDDIAQTALFICKLPPRAVVEDVTVWGIDQVVNPL